MSDKLLINIKAKSENVDSRLNSVIGKLKGISASTDKADASTKRWYNSTKKLNQSFTNINKDANRSAQSISKMSSSLNSIKGAVSLYAVANGLAKVIQSSIDATETANLFKVALGDMGDEAQKTVDELNSVYGLDPTNLKNSIGSFALLARSMGMSSKQAEILSTNTTKMALDLSSLMNIPINQVMQDLRSGLVGQSETVYKYGLDVTEAGLKTEAMAMGISKSVRNMTQGEKMALRYSAMIRQASISNGDFANTLNMPANQLKILAERVVTAGRAIGNIFMPLLKAVLPYLNAFMILVIKCANALASFFGYDPKDFDSASNAVGDLGDNLNGVSEDADTASGAIDGATDAVNDYKKAIMGIDQVNIIPAVDTSASSGSGSGGTGGDAGSILEGLDLPTWASIASTIPNQADAIAKSLVEMFTVLSPTMDALGRLWNNVLSKFLGFTWQALKDFWDNFLKPVGAWTLGQGLPQLIDAFTNLFSDIDWDGLNSALSDFWDAVAPLATAFGQGFVDFISDTYDKLKPAVTQAFSDIASAISDIAEALKKIDPKTAEGFGQFVGWVVELAVVAKVVSVIAGVLTSIGEFFVGIKTWGAGATAFFGVGGGGAGLMAFISGLGQVVSSQGAYLPAYLDTLVASMPEDWQEWINDIETSFNGFFDDLYGAIWDSWVSIFNFDTTLKFFDDMIANFTDAFDGGDDQWWEIGGNIVMGILNGIAGAFSTILEPINDLFMEIVNGIKDVFGIASPAKEMNIYGQYILEGIVAGFTGAFSTMWTAITKFGTDTGTKLSTAWATAKKGIGDLSVKFSATVSTAVSTIQTGWNNLSKYWKDKQVKFSSYISTGYTTIKNGWNTLSGYWKDKTVKFKVSLTTTATSIKAFINSVIDAINKNVIAKLDFSIKAPAWLGGAQFGWSAPRIPKLAKGGIVDSGQIYQAGEAGKEAIVPLERNTQWMDMISNKLGGGNGSLTKADMKQAFKEAIKESDFGDTMLYIGNEQVARASNKGNKMLNRRYKLVTE